METIFKAFIGLFFTVVLCVGGISMTISSIHARNADLFAADAASKIRNSHYAATVIAECEREAEENGYTLWEEPYDLGTNISAGTLYLTYHNTVSFFGIDKERTVRADL